MKSPSDFVSEFRELRFIFADLSCTEQVLAGLLDLRTLSIESLICRASSIRSLTKAPSVMPVNTGSMVDSRRIRAQGLKSVPFTRVRTQLSTERDGGPGTS
jgi:hypothetical protein